MHQIKMIIFFFLTAVIMLSCAHTKPQEPPVDTLFQTAVTQAKDGQVDKAAESFMKVRTYYPGHELAKESLLALGDLYYDHKEYETALMSYQEFRMLYPTDQKAEYSFFRIAMCHSNQILTFDRDQTATSSAIKAFEDFLKLYPSSPYQPEAQEKLTEAKRVLANNYLYIGKFYLHKKKMEAACRRFSYVKDNFSGIGLDDEVAKLSKQACKQK